MKASQQFNQSSMRELRGALSDLGFCNSKIDDTLRNLFENDRCPVCMDLIYLPVIHDPKGCEEGSKCPKQRMCLPCARRFLRLNLPKEERTREHVKHMFCGAFYDLNELTSRDYVVDLGSLDASDRVGIQPPPCRKCNKQCMTYKRLYAHTSPSWRAYLGCPDEEECTGVWRE